MEPNRSRALPLLIALLACCASYVWPMPVARVSVEVAQVRVSVGIDRTVQNRTLLSDIAQFAAWLDPR